MKRFLTVTALSSAIVSLCCCTHRFELDNHIGISRSIGDAQAALDAGANYMEVNVQEYLVPEEDDEVFLKKALLPWFKIQRFCLHRA